MKWNRIAVGIAMTALLTIAGCGACGGLSKSFNEGFCPSFKESFLKSCTDTCAKKDTLETCTTRCQEELPKQGMYAKRCMTGGSTAAPAASP